MNYTQIAIVRRRGSMTIEDFQAEVNDILTKSIDAVRSRSEFVRTSEIKIRDIRYYPETRESVAEAMIIFDILDKTSK